MTPVKVQFIGSGDAYGSGGRLQACILLDAAPGRVLVDCGATSLVGLKCVGIDPSRIDAILASHLHVDHFGQTKWITAQSPMCHATLANVETNAESRCEAYRYSNSTITLGASHG